MSAMSKLNNKDRSALVLTVVALDEYFSELAHLSSRIGEMPLESDSDIEQMQRLLSHFNRCGQDISEQVAAMSSALNESRTKAEAAARLVAVKAEELQALQNTRQKKMDEFRSLADRVQALNVSLKEMNDGGDNEKISKRLSEVSLELHPLIDKAQAIRMDARKSKMKALEQGAESLGQSLVSVSQKLSAYQQSQYVH
jgi:hypothetical protein